MKIDRTEINRALSKAIAYKACGKDQQAKAWCIRLIELLDECQIISQDEMSRYQISKGVLLS